MSGLNWEALKWKDGTKYDGQATGKLCEGVGTIQHPNGDRYEGELRAGRMEGYGVYVWKGGTLYRGHWNKDHMEGCGVRMSRQADGEFMIQEGQFVGDNFLGTFMDCGLSDARVAAAEADIAASRAAHFKVSDNVDCLPIEDDQPSSADKKTDTSRNTGTEQSKGWFESFMQFFGKSKA